VFGPQSLVRLSPTRRLCPDAYLVSKEDRLRPLTTDFQGVPILVADLLSPTKRDHQRQRLLMYQEAGVSEIWFVDMDHRQVTIHRHRAQGYRKETVRQGIARSKALPGFWLDTAWLWQDPPPSYLTCIGAILADR